MREPPYLLGIDLGGSGCKSAVYTLEGEILGQGYEEYAMLSSTPGQAEHDAEGWWQATIQVIRKAIEDVNPQDIRAIGIGCTNGLICVDRRGKPLRSAIMLWDQRTLPEVERMRSVLGDDEIFQVTGNPAAPGAYSLPTILWLKFNQPDLFNDCYKFMVPGGYLVARLTGNFTIDFSRACTTLLFDIRLRRWHHPFLKALGIPMDKLPQPMASRAIAGGITAAAAEVTGLLPETPVVAGLMDTLGAAVGSGRITDGNCFIIMGTAARVAVPVSSPIFDRRFMNCTGVRPETWVSIGAINGVGSSLRWARDVIALEEGRRAASTDRDVYDLMTEQAEQSPPGAKGLLYLPYIAGERTPIWDPYARGVLFGLSLGHTRSDLFRAFLEGPAFAMWHIFEILEKEMQISVGSVHIGGAAAKSAVWNQIIADVLGRPIITLRHVHTEVLGAAVIAGVGAGLYKDLDSGIARVAKQGRRYQPDLEAHQVYRRMFPLYLDLYQNVHSHFRDLVEMNLPQGWIRSVGEISQE